MEKLGRNLHVEYTGDFQLQQKALIRFRRWNEVPTSKFHLHRAAQLHKASVIMSSFHSAFRWAPTSDFRLHDGFWVPVIKENEIQTRDKSIFSVLLFDINRTADKWGVLNSDVCVLLDEAESSSAMQNRAQWFPRLIACLMNKHEFTFFYKRRLHLSFSKCRQDASMCVCVWCFFLFLKIISTEKRGQMKHFKHQGNKYFFCCVEKTLNGRWVFWQKKEVSCVCLCSSSLVSCVCKLVAAVIEPTLLVILIAGIDILLVLNV